MCDIFRFSLESVTQYILLLWQAAKHCVSTAEADVIWSRETIFATVQILNNKETIFAQARKQSLTMLLDGVEADMICPNSKPKVCWNCLLAVDHHLDLDVKAYATSLEGLVTVDIIFWLTWQQLEKVFASCLNMFQVWQAWVNMYSLLP